MVNYCISSFFLSAIVFESDPRFLLFRKGDGIIALSPKTYHCFMLGDVQGTGSKYSCKGTQKVLNQLNATHYYKVLRTQQKHWVENRGENSAVFYCVLYHCVAFCLQDCGSEMDALSSTVRGRPDYLS